MYSVNLPENADPTTTTSGIPNVTPILAIIGINIIAATVWDTTVAIVPQKNSMHNNENQAWDSGRATKIYI